MIAQVYAESVDKARQGKRRMGKIKGVLSGAATAIQTPHCGGASNTPG